MSKVRYYILGPKGISPREGRSFEVGNPPQTFFYCKDGTEYVVTMPDSGISAITGHKLKDCKDFIIKYWDELMNICSTEQYKNASRTFLELVEIEEEKRKNGEDEDNS